MQSVTARRLAISRQSISFFLSRSLVCTVPTRLVVAQKRDTNFLAVGFSRFECPRRRTIVTRRRYFVYPLQQTNQPRQEFVGAHFRCHVIVAILRNRIATPVYDQSLSDMTTVNVRVRSAGAFLLERVCIVIKCRSGSVPT